MSPRCPTPETLARPACDHWTPPGTAGYGRPMHDDTTTDPAVPLAMDLFNQTWDLLDRSDRSPDDDLAMLGRALGSWTLWRRVDDPRRHAISDWQVSRVFAELGDAGWAQRYAAAGLTRCRDHGLGPFLEAYALESEARAAHVAEDTLRRDAAVAASREIAARIEDPDERQLVLDDLDDLRSRRPPG